MADTDRRAVLQRAVEACVVGDVEALPDLFTADVSGWSPNMLVGSLDDLREIVAYREDALAGVKLHADAVDVFGNKGLMEYRVSAVFSGSFFVDEEFTIEPNGRELVIGAALVAEFSDGKISTFRNYFDDAALMEQMLAD
jgi:ketosteroid isomerase-like protein